MNPVARYLVSQFGNPRGPVGTLVGEAMAFKNRPRIRWVVERLDPQPGDRILEVGFGPGTSIDLMTRRIPGVTVHGIEKSELMVRRATRALAGHVASGTVTLQVGTPERLPFPDATFGKAVAINTVMFWPDPVGGLREIRRVLVPGGRLLVAWQPHGARTPEARMRAGAKLLAQVREAGFEDAELSEKAFRTVPCLLVESHRRASR